MTDRNSAISTTGVVFAAVGAAVQDYGLQILGLLVTVLVHLWTEKAKRDAARKDNEDMIRLRRKCRSMQHLIGSLQHRLDIAEAHGYRPPWEEPVKHIGHPTPLGLLLTPEQKEQLENGTVLPPFPPGEACSDV